MALSHIPSHKEAALIYGTLTINKCKLYAINHWKQVQNESFKDPCNKHHLALLQYASSGGKIVQKKKIPENTFTSPSIF